MSLSKYDFNKYDSWSSLYDTLMLAGYYDYDAYVDCLVSAIETYSLRSCLELGIGTGLVASRLADRTEIDLLGIDFSESMVEICRKNFPTLNTVVADIASYEFGDTFEMIFSVGVTWYFMENDDGLMFCSHLPEPELQAQSIGNVCKAMRPGSVLALAIQGPHVNKKLNINEALEYSQVIRTKNDDGTVFEKDYIFTELGKKVCCQTCLFRLTDQQQIDAEFRDHGLENIQLANDKKFIFYRKL